MRALGYDSPYRVHDSPLTAREKALEDELAWTRERMTALADEEVRLLRRVLLRETPAEELAAVRHALFLACADEKRLASELSGVRGELAARGIRRLVARRRDEAQLAQEIGLVVLFLVLAGILLLASGRQSW